MNWHRVTRQNPCPICRHPDWCTVSEIGRCCMRVSNDRPLKNGGWLWRHDGAAPNLQVKERPMPIINVPELMARFSRASPSWRVEALAKDLGVTVAALMALGCAWASEYKAFAFPMRDSGNNQIGIRLRDSNGRKWAVTGSHQGLFIPQCDRDKVLWIFEGPTDTAAALTIGLFGIGRPSCSGGVDQLKQFMKRNRFSRAVIVSDLDDPGIRGAGTLQEHLPIPSCLLVPPAKDIREFVQFGGTKELIESMTNNLIWKQPTPTHQTQQPGPFLYA